MRKKRGGDPIGRQFFASAADHPSIYMVFIRTATGGRLAVRKNVTVYVLRFPGIDEFL